ncbi:unnamed protein product [Prunus armeniaca]|uniref:NAC domain-containing protein n=1 Tax=Prunus armeniaca TaxID=36596 RepID=A0A6J5X4A8_PRUAR|nr:unnamed protein product [Prunus armeniaca]
MGGYYQVPVGYKFRPSEEELFLHYLLSRLNGEDYRKGVVPNCDLYGFFVFGLCCFWVLQQPQHRRLLSLKLIWNFAVLKVGKYITRHFLFLVLKNTRKVFSENHNMLMDTHKVFIALSIVGFRICTFTTERSLQELSV